MNAPLETVTSVAKLAAPYGKELELQQVQYDNGFTMLRLRIREGRRFTIVDLDPGTAAQWAAVMGEWAQQQGGEKT